MLTVFLNHTEVSLWPLRATPHQVFTFSFALLLEISPTWLIISCRGYSHSTPSQAAQHCFSAPTNQNKSCIDISIAYVDHNCLFCF